MANIIKQKFPIDHHVISHNIFFKNVFNTVIYKNIPFFLKNIYFLYNLSNLNLFNFNNLFFNKNSFLLGNFVFFYPFYKNLQLFFKKKNFKIEAKNDLSLFKQLKKNFRLKSKKIKIKDLKRSGLFENKINNDFILFYSNIEPYNSKKKNLIIKKKVNRRKWRRIKFIKTRPFKLRFLSVKNYFPEKIKIIKEQRKLLNLQPLQNSKLNGSINEQITNNESRIENTNLEITTDSSFSLGNFLENQIRNLYYLNQNLDSTKSSLQFFKKNNKSTTLLLQYFLKFENTDGYNNIFFLKRNNFIIDPFKNSHKLRSFKNFLINNFKLLLSNAYKLNSFSKFKTNYINSYFLNFFKIQILHCLPIINDNIHYISGRKLFYSYRTFFKKSLLLKSFGDLTMYTYPMYKNTNLKKNSNNLQLSIVKLSKPDLNSSRFFRNLTHYSNKNNFIEIFHKLNFKKSSVTKSPMFYNNFYKNFNYFFSSNKSRKILPKKIEKVDTDILIRYLVNRLVKIRNDLEVDYFNLSTFNDELNNLYKLYCGPIDERNKYYYEEFEIKKSSIIFDSALNYINNSTKLSKKVKSILLDYYDTSNDKQPEDMDYYTGITRVGKRYAKIITEYTNLFNDKPDNRNFFQKFMKLYWILFIKSESPNSFRKVNPSCFKIHCKLNLYDSTMTKSVLSVLPADVWYPYQFEDLDSVKSPNSIESLLYDTSDVRSSYKFFEDSYNITVGEYVICKLVERKWFIYLNKFVLFFEDNDSDFFHFDNDSFKTYFSQKSDSNLNTSTYTYNFFDTVFDLNFKNINLFTKKYYLSDFKSKLLNKFRFFLKNYIFLSDFFFINYNLLQLKKSCFHNYYDFAMRDIVFNNFNAVNIDYNYYNNYNLNLTIYNNHYPIFEKYVNLDRFFSNFQVNVIYNFYKYINIYVLSFFEFFTKSKFFLKPISNNLFKINELEAEKLEFIFSKYKNNRFKIHKDFFIIEFIELVWYTFQLRDVTLLSNWFIKIFKKISFKNHKKFLSVFKTIITDNFELFSLNTSVTGLYFELRGKIGVTGNAKKKSLFFRAGTLNFFKKKIRIDQRKENIRLNAGCVGLNIYITFK